VQWNPVQILSLLQLSSLLSSQPNVLPPPDPTITRRTNGHCLGTFIAVNIDLFPPLPPTFSSLFLSLQIGKVNALLYFVNFVLSWHVSSHMML
jgi:hypothetical protein